MVSNFGAAFSAMIGATFWARFFPVFALGPVLVTLGVFFDNNDLIEWGTNFQTNNGWIFVGGLSMIVLMTAILIAGTRRPSAGRTRSGSSPSLGTFLAFLVLLLGNTAGFTENFNSLNAEFGGGTAKTSSPRPGTAGVAPDLANFDATLPTVFAIMVFMMWNWWSVYLSGELKSASDRGRQLSVMFGALLLDGLFIVIGLVLFFNVVRIPVHGAEHRGQRRLRDPERPVVPVPRLAGRTTSRSWP